MTSVDSKQLQKSLTPLLALSREKTTNKEKEKETLLETLSRKRKKDNGFLSKEKDKKNIFRDLVTNKKRRKDTRMYPCLAGEVVTSFPDL